MTAATPAPVNDAPLAPPRYVEGPCPGATWEMRLPEEVGLSRQKLAELAAHVQGWGVVVRGGYLAYTWGDPSYSADLASARKPIISTLLLIAVQEGLIGSVD